ncbi:MAG: D-alanyl-D-alanine carboxypeptidase [Loktanella salsilacus]|uniref:D-alanyl-D-alanine carboxypeptidase n=2 Tax=Loktanella salsilacus TaxID=195913 RepID=A0A1I4HRU9_9RHOB|nr:D-alanyl-D-alanine carboxypeptidase [Loktanella salsilacus]
MQNRPHTRAMRAISVMLFLALTPVVAFAAPYAAYVMDARTGEQLYSQNADTRLHPASLTKMMTLYIAFQAIQRGEITLDSMVTVTSNASAEPPSKLGLKTGQQIKLRYLLRAAAVKSANDAATAIGEAISGSEEAFAVRMNRTAAAMGMTNTTFKNANGLTQEGHLSTARDMSVLGRHVIYDFPQYYNLFSRRTADAGIAEVRHTNRRFLDSYEGADGIKTGFTNAAGFNLVASAQRGQERIIATVFGGTSTAQRNGKIKELMDMGFNRAPANATLQRPQPPSAAPATDPLLVSSNVGPATNGGAGKTVRVSGRVSRSLRPAARPTQAVSAPVQLAVDTDLINSVLAEAVQVAAVAPAAGAIASAPAAPEVVTRISTSGGRHWGVNVGRYNSRYEAEKVLLRVALNEMSTLDGAVRRVTQNARGFDANFMGLTREGADLACRRLQARSQSCFMIGSEG